MRRDRLAHDAEDLVALVEQKLGQERPVLAGYPDDECAARGHLSADLSARVARPGSGVPSRWLVGNCSRCGDG